MNKKIRTSKGFTLAELLIVVAIIGVLVAISIPIFTKQLERSREATDLANVRSAYAMVRTAAISGEAGDSGVTVDAKGIYSMSVPLVQKQDDWQTSEKALNIGGIVRSDGQHWREIPAAGGSCKVTCSAEGETIIYWAGGGGYTPAQVSDSAKPYEPAINALLSTLYNNIVADRLDSDKNHIAYVQFNKGKVTEVKCYPNKANADKAGSKGQDPSGLTAEEIAALNDDISKALAGTGYKLFSSTERIFFDWEGNAYSNAKEDGSGTNGVGGQGAYATIGLVSDSGGKKIALTNKDGTWTLE